ncbi:MAG: GAF domain-containing SpoIIE family protein phosphatase [Balneolaceae bacterium]|nr:GAF domain-containing SpoIIE family protein phosphatase [Balneolaceae bacterium]
MADKDRLAQENQKLQAAVNELSVLNEIATTISSTQPLDDIIDQIVLKCIKHLEVEEGAISLLEKSDKGEEQEKAFQTMIRKQDISKERLPIRLDDRVTGWMLKNKKPLLSNDIANDDRFKISGDAFGSFHSLLSVPLIIKGNLIGYLAVFNKKGGKEFTEQDRRLLSIIASESAQVIENARLYEEEKALISLKEEMRLAKDIQLRLLPESNPDIAGYQICGTNIPAKEVGGDYYDFINLDDNRLGFCVGDITGKGMPAAMLMANLQAALRSQTLMLTEESNCMKNMNKLLHNSTESTKFATLFFGILDYQNDLISYCNGGHDQPIYMKDGAEASTLETTGMLLGVLEDAQYDKKEIQLNSGDLLVLYTDGITEAMNEEDEEFGQHRLINLIRENRDAQADTLMELITEEVQEHSRNVSQSDDITLMVIRKE